VAIERGARVGPALALGALLACSVPVPFADDLLFSTGARQLPVAEDCRRCHGEVVSEWSESPHAHAWSSPHFTALTADHEATPCLGCHAPAPLGSAGEIALRAEHRAEGVTCVSCHLAPDANAAPLSMRGPHARTSPLEVHPVVVDALFQKPDLCGTCHAEVLEQWRAAPAPADGSDKKICQECHMPSVRRTIESVDPERAYSRVFVALGKAVDGRRHRFDVPADPWKHVALDARRDGAKWVVEVRNDMPHALPTGAFGRREARVRAGETSIPLRNDLRESVPAGAVRHFELEAAPETAVVLERRDPRSGVWQRLAPAPLGAPQ
jgi:ribosomal protein L40E